MRHLNIKVDRSLRARIQASLQDTISVPGSATLSRFVGNFGAWRRSRALKGAARIKTIVIGSQTFGGAGKTPVALHLAQQLSSNVKVGVLVRPTRRASKFEGVVQLSLIHI